VSQFGDVYDVMSFQEVLVVIEDMNERRGDGDGSKSELVEVFVGL
jgi:hypothetical protein